VIPVLLIATAAALMPWRRTSFTSGLLAALVLGGLSAGAMIDVSGARLDRLFLAPQMAELLNTGDPNHLHPTLVAGYSEASVPFLLGTDVKLLDHGAVAAERAAKVEAANAFIESREIPNFERRAAELGLNLQLVATTKGRNYANGREVEISFFQTTLKPSADGGPAPH